MVKINMKPLSVNDAWVGGRKKSNKYKKFEKDCFLLIPMRKIENKPIELIINFGFSSKGSDLDNPLKMCIDILSKKLGFNYNMIYKLIITKEIVSKGNDYFEYEFTTKE